MFAAASEMTDHFHLRALAQQRLHSNFINARAAQNILQQNAVFDRETRRLNALLLEESARVEALTIQYTSLHAQHQRLLEERNTLLTMIRNHQCPSVSCVATNNTIEAF